MYGYPASGTNPPPVLIQTMGPYTLASGGYKIYSVTFPNTESFVQLNGDLTPPEDPTGPPTILKQFVFTDALSCGHP